MTVQEAKEFQELKSKSEANAVQVSELKEEVKSLRQKQDVIYKMNENLSLMTQSLKIVEKDVSDVKTNQKQLSDKVAAIENAPAKASYDSLRKIKVAVVTALATTVASGILAIVISLMNK